MTDNRTVDHHSHGGHHHAPHAHGDHAEHHHHHGPAADAGKVKDPVCGMMVDPHETPHRAQYEGKPYYFCSTGCQSKFKAEPAKYVEPATARKA
jgi:P-type Cu+ transporter